MKRASQCSEIVEHRLVENLQMGLDSWQCFEAAKGCEDCQVNRLITNGYRDMPRISSFWTNDAERDVGPREVRTGWDWKPSVGRHDFWPCAVNVVLSPEASLQAACMAMELMSGNLSALMPALHHNQSIEVLVAELKKFGFGITLVVHAQ